MVGEEGRTGSPPRRPHAKPPGRPVWPRVPNALPAAGPARLTVQESEVEPEEQAQRGAPPHLQPLGAGPTCAAAAG